MKLMGTILRGWRATSAIAIAGLGLAACTAIAKPVKSSDDGPDSLVGKPAPDLSFKAYGSNAAIDLSDLRGKMVVVDFFRAENESDSSSFDDVIDAERQYGRKGVAVVGVSMDENQAPLVGLFQKKPNIDWPIDYDAMGFAGATALRWKASHQTGALNFMTFWHIDYIVSPDGSVLWVGQTKDLNAAIEDQIKDHKPQVVDARVMTDAKTAMDKMQAAMTGDKIGEAFHERARIPREALADDDFAAQVKDADDKLQAAGDAALAAVDPLIASKDFAGAVAKLKDLSNGADGTPLAGKARVKLAELQKDPEARAALQAAEKSAHADDALKVAQKLQADKRDQQAYTHYKFIVKTFAGTPAAQTATDAIAAYDADPQFKKIQAASPSAASSDGNSAAPAGGAPAKPDPARAKGLLSLADSYRDAGNTDKARIKYQDVVSQFPGTPEADTARDELAKLPQ